MVHGCIVYTELAEMEAVSCGTSHASAVSTPQGLGRSYLPQQGRNLLPWSADTPCTHHAPYTHRLVEGHMHTHTLCIICTIQM